VSARGAILVYHRVGALVPDTWSLCVAPERFRAHLALLVERFRPMALDALAEAAAAGALPEGAVAVTLDDGTLDHLAAAAPLLDEARVPATLFVSSGRLDEPHEHWWDTLERICHSAELAAVHARLLRLPLEERELRMAELSRRSGLDLSPRESHRALTASELARVAGRLSIGSHTANHLWLPALSPEAREREIAGDKAALEARLDRPVTTFSYPFGAHDEATVAQVRRAGFRAAVTVEERAVGAGEPPLLLPRIDAARLDPAALADRLAALLAA
jgi:peptidoglycan/xylan/chitin deacetylase (PgdA/CDA1 family)